MAKNQSRVLNSTLSRKQGFKTRAPLKRTAWLRSKSPHSKERFQKTGFVAKKPRLKQMSKKRKRQLTKSYFPLTKEFLALPENRYCYHCIGRSTGESWSGIRKLMLGDYQTAEKVLGACNAITTPATEVHHYAGRIGRLLTFVPWFIPECRGCREWPHDNAREARALDLIASATIYNVFPENAAQLLEEYEKRSSSF